MGLPKMTANFNPTLVQFKPAAAAWERLKRHEFQSYLSPIQTPAIIIHLSSKKQFQSYLSPIQTHLLRSLLHDLLNHFNPTLVQFKPRSDGYQ